MKEENKVDKTLAGLKDFQRSTVDYVFDQLYFRDRNKILIADEVGLGKTIVAKGIIAKAYRHFVETKGRPSFRVVYVCSNQALAKQNLTKLNFTEDENAIDFSQEDDRITSLAYVRPKSEGQSFSIKAFTPATSFDDRTHAGKADERRLLYRLLYQYDILAPHKNSLKWILKGNRRIKDETWENLIRWAEEYDLGKNNWLSPIRREMGPLFRKSLKEMVSPKDMPRCFEALGTQRPMKIWDLLKQLCALGIRKNNYHQHHFQKELISRLRFELSQSCIKFLNADIFILDEFQRYKQLIEMSNDEEPEGSANTAAQLARDIFKMHDAKVIMLSATPFKPYTNDFDEQSGEVHYKEFSGVLKFLMDDLPEEAWNEYYKNRDAFFSLLRHPDQIQKDTGTALSLKNNLESLYRKGMVRTERNLAASSGDYLVTSTTSPLQVVAEDIEDFVALDRITHHLNTHYEAGLIIPLEYVKSSPYALSFLDSYAHKKKLEEVAQHDMALVKLLRTSKYAWINTEAINEYKSLVPPGGKSIPNARFRLLLEETVSKGYWKLLWIPPCIPYYPLTGAFTDTEGFSKTLLFSSWKMVPRMIAALLSYEVERLTIGNPVFSNPDDTEAEKHYYFKKKRSPRPIFTFKLDYRTGEPGQMNNFMLTYPCQFLASLYDPADNLHEKKSQDQILETLASRIKTTLSQLDLNQYARAGEDWQKWYWIAPLILDKMFSDQNLVLSFLENPYRKADDETSMDADVANDKEEKTGRSRHFELARKIFKYLGSIEAGKLDAEKLDQLSHHLVKLTLGSPTISFLRTLQRYDQYPDLVTLQSSSAVGSAFLTMLNKPESISVVRLSTVDNDYWQQCLEYLISGNIQSLLDEYVYLLRDSENLKSSHELAEYISDVLSIRTSSIEVDGLKEFLQNLTKEKPKKKSMRAHFAIDFGSQKLNTAKASGRQINTRQAFNSPFRPFVLASTSIGQEGLDFHFFCKQIFHWNLPSNPIDFEQREGRINRYKGLVIRQALTKKYARSLTQTKSNEIWSALFKQAEGEKTVSSFPCDLIPFWHTAPVDGISIQRFVPLYPFSRDHQRYADLIRVLTYYRLTFGQPRQDELIDALHMLGMDDQLKAELHRFMIDLAPISFTRHGKK
jgi:hypothetical protein